VRKAVAVVASTLIDHNGPTPSERHEHSRWFSDLKEQLLQRVAPEARRLHSRTCPTSMVSPIRKAHIRTTPVSDLPLERLLLISSSRRTNRTILEHLLGAPPEPSAPSDPPKQNGVYQPTGSCSFNRRLLGPSPLISENLLHAIWSNSLRTTYVHLTSCETFYYP